MSTAKERERKGKHRREMGQMRMWEVWREGDEFKGRRGKVG